LKGLSLSSTARQPEQVPQRGHKGALDQAVESFAQLNKTGSLSVEQLVAILTRFSTYSSSRAAESTIRQQYLQLSALRQAFAIF
jgi:hypothetical protein